MTPQNKPGALPQVVPYGFEPQNPQMQAGASSPSLQAQLQGDNSSLSDQIRQHRHNGLLAPQNELSTDIAGLFEVVSAIPSGTPSNLYDQIKIYTNGATYRLYWYDQVNHAWRYAAGT